MRWKFLTAFIFLVIGIILQLSIGGAINVWFNFSLAALIVATFFLNFLELLVLILLAVFILNWQPAFSLEMALYVVLPLLVLWLRKFLPLKSWLGNLLAIFVCFLFFYLVIDARFLLVAPAVFLRDIAGGLVFGAIFFKSCEATA